MTGRMTRRTSGDVSRRDFVKAVETRGSSASMPPSAWADQTRTPDSGSERASISSGIASFAWRPWGPSTYAAAKRILGLSLRRAEARDLMPRGPTRPRANSARQRTSGSGSSIAFRRRSTSPGDSAGESPADLTSSRRPWTSSLSDFTDGGGAPPPPPQEQAISNAGTAIQERPISHLSGGRTITSTGGGGGSTALRLPEGRVVEVEAVEELRVLVARRRRRPVGKLLGVAPLEDQHRRLRRRELRMKPRIVERVVVVGEHLDRGPPGPRQRLRFRVPELSEGRRLPEGFHEHGDPALTESVPRDRARVRLDRLSIGRRGQAFLGFENLPGGGILPGFKGGRAAKRRQGIAEVDPRSAVGVLEERRMAIGRGRLFGGRLGLRPQDATEFKCRRVVIPDAEAGLIGFQGRLDLDVRAAEMRRARLVGEADVAADPGRPRARHLGHAAGSPGVVREIVQLEPERRFERCQRPHRGGGARHVINTQRIPGHQGVAPGPEQLAAVDGVLDAVAAHDPRLLPVEVLAELLAFGKEARPRQATEPFGDDGAPDFDLQRLPRLGSQPEAVESEAVLRRFVPVAVDVEPGFPAHEFREVEGDDARVIGHEADLIDRAQLDEGDGPARSRLHHFDPARVTGGGGHGDGAKQQRTRHEAPPEDRG